MGGARPSAPVLVVEDNPETRDVLALVLRLEGYAVETAADGQEALDYLRAGKSACLILLDLFMPIMNGWTLHDLLKQDERLRDLPVIAFSVVMDQRDVPQGVIAIRKGTLDPDALLRVVEHNARPDVRASC
jgi:CheY-like chemotaxis protein